MVFEDFDEIVSFCLNKPCAYESRPFGPDLICYRVSGKIFCQLSTKQEWFKVTLKTNPEVARLYRQAYPGIVVRGYHCPPVQQPYWNTVELYGISKDILFQMIDEAYDEVVKGLTRKERDRIPRRNCFVFRKTESNDTIVIYNNDKPVGEGSLSIYDEETIELKSVYVDENARCIGLGKDLILRLEAEAKIQGFRYVILEVEDLSETAQHLFHKLGYKVLENGGFNTEPSKSVRIHKKI